MTKNRKLGRLRKRSEFLYVREGQYRAIGGVVIQMRENTAQNDDIRVGFTATKKIGGAVVRNKATRRLRARAGADVGEHAAPARGTATRRLSQSPCVW